MWTYTESRPIADKLNAKIVGSVKTKGHSNHDLDLLIQTYTSKVDDILNSLGYKFISSQLVSPNEIRKSRKFGKNSTNWLRNRRFENLQNKKIIEVWNTEMIDEIIKKPVLKCLIKEVIHEIKSSCENIRRLKEPDVLSAIFSIKRGLKEVNQRDINSRHPQSRHNWDKNWNPKLDTMTLDNLKSLRRKESDMHQHIISQPEPDFVMADKHYELSKIYDDEIKRRLKYINKPILKEFGDADVGMSCLGQSTNAERADITQMERDPLNDPRLNGKLNEENEKTEHFSVKWNEPDISKVCGKIFLGNEWFANAIPIKKEWDPKHAGTWVVNAHLGAKRLGFKSGENYYKNIQSLLDALEKWYSSRKLNETFQFKDVDDVREPLKLPDGFGILTEVYYNDMYIGSIISTLNGYILDVVDTPKKVKPIVRDNINNFKSKNLAADALHRLWKKQRTE